MSLYLTDTDWRDAGPVRGLVNQLRPFANLKPRTAPIRALVYHWTGAENPARIVARNLVKLRYSVHFVIDADGTITQLCPLDRHAMHCGWANRWTVGVELVSRGANRHAPERGVKRPQLSERIHGRSIVYAGFTEPQTRSACALNTALLHTLQLPRALAFDAAGEPHPGVVPRAALAHFRGILGHFQLSTQKTDPGLSLLRALRQEPPC